MHFLHLIMLIISVKFNQRRKFVLKPFFLFFFVTDLNENAWKKWKNNLHLVKNSPSTPEDRTSRFLFFFWSGILATADHRVSSRDCSEERFSLKSYYIYLVCSVYCVWFSVWLGSKILGPLRTGRGWISEEWSYSRDVKIFLEDCVSNLRLLSSSLFDGLTPQMNALSPIQ